MGDRPNYCKVLEVEEDDTMYWLDREAPYHRIPDIYEDEVNYNKDYYSRQNFQLCGTIFRQRNRNFLLIFAGILFIFLFLMFSFDRHSADIEDNRVYTKMSEDSTATQMPLVAQTLAIPKENMEKCLSAYLSSIDPNEKYPDDVNQIKPHHIRVIGSMGDSLTIGSRASNFVEQSGTQYPGNAYFTGMDSEVDGHLTIYNIFRYIAGIRGTQLFGGSTGQNYGPNSGLNVAVGGRKSDDIPRQAKDLVERIRKIDGINIKEDWKLVSLWIGTNDVGNLGYGDVDPIPPQDYKEKIAEGLLYLKENLPRTIVTVIAMFEPELLQEANSILTTGKRAKDIENQQKIDKLTEGYRQAVYDIQNDKKFQSSEFTVVVQPFATKYSTPYKDKLGNYNTAFYGYDLFHTGKLGHAIIAKHYWQNLFEKVGSKTDKADLGDTTQEIYHLDKDNSYIKTVGNSG